VWFIGSIEALLNEGTGITNLSRNSDNLIHVVLLWTPANNRALVIIDRALLAIDLTTTPAPS
jgi:hypothetical protein